MGKDLSKNTKLVKQPERRYSPPGTRLRAEVRAAMKRREPGRDLQPISHVEWVDPASLHSNDFNPNRVFGPEFRLLKISLLEIGWTAPLVATHDDEMVDGFHRWWLALNDREVLELGEGAVPIVRVDVDEATHRMSTIRMNRARGQHHVVRMADIVAELEAMGLTVPEIASRLQMQEEEVFRLSQRGNMKERGSTGEFSASWAPDHEADVEAQARVDEVVAQQEGERKGRRKTEPVRGEEK